MSDASRVLVELRLLGAAAMSQGAKSAGRGLASLGASGKTAAAGLLTTAGASDKATSAVDRFRLAAKETSTGVVRLGSGLATAGGAVLAFGRKAGTIGAFALAAGLYEGTKATIQFDRAMANVNSIAQLTPGRLMAISKAVLAMGGKTAQQPLTLAQGLYDLVSSGFNAANSLVILKASAFAATAGLSDTATSTHAIVAVLNAYHLSAASAAHVSDLLFQTVNKGIITFPELADSIGTILPYAATLHVSLGQLGGAITDLTRQGLNPSLTMTALRQILVSMLKPSSALKTEFAALGMTGEGLIRKEGLVGALSTLVSITNGSKSSIAALFPNVRALNGVFALTGKNAKYASQDVASFKDVHGATMRALAKQAQSVSYQWGKLKSTATGLAITVGQTLVPSMRRGLAAVSGFLSPTGSGGSAVTSFVAGLATGATTIVRGGAHPVSSVVAPGAQLAGVTTRRDVGIGVRQVGGFFTGLGGGKSKSAPMAAQIGRDTTATVKALIAFTSGAVRTTVAVIRTVGPVVVEYARRIIWAFKPIAPLFTNALFPLIKGVALGLAVTLKGVMDILIISTRAAALALGLLGKALAPLKWAFEITGFVIGIAFGGEIIKAIDGTLALAGTVGGKLGPAFDLLRVPVKAAGYALDIVEGSVRLVFRALGNLVGVLGDAVTWTGRFAGMLDDGLVRTVLLKVTNAIGGIINGFEALPGSVATATGDIFKWLETKIGAAPVKLIQGAVNIGVAIVKAIARGIAKSPGAVTAAIIGLLPGPIRGAAKKALGIASYAIPGSGAVKAGRGAIRAGKGAVDFAKSVFSGNGPFGLASGGHVQMGGWAVVGERGPELARLPGGTTVYDHRQSRAVREAPTMASMVTPVVNFLAQLTMPDGKVLHAEVFRIERGLAEAL